MSAIARLAKAKLRRFKPPTDTYKPVDLRPVRARLTLAIIAGHHGRKRKSESELTAFARAMRVSVDKLWRLAYADRKRFAKRLLVVDPRADADDVADAIVRQFICDEITYQVVEAAIVEAGLWLASIMGSPPWPGLCRMRPLRPPCTENPSDICDPSG